MAYRRLSGMQRLRKAQADRAERKRRKMASEKKGKDELTPLLTRLPSRPKLRTATPAQRRRISKPKGGQTLMDMARAGGERRRAEKAKRVGGKEYVTPLPRRKSPAPKRKIPAGARSFRGVAPKKAGAAPRTTRTGAQRAADKKMWQAKQKEARKESAGMKYGSEFKIPGLSKKDREGMEESVKLGAGGGLGKIAAAGVGAGALKLYQMYKAKKATDLVKATAKAKRLKKAEDKAAEKIRKAYEQFEKDRKARSRKMGRRK